MPVIIIITFLLSINQYATAKALANTKPENNKSSINTAKDWFDKGIALVKSKKYKEAIECFDKALLFNPQYVRAWHNKGVALTDLGEYQEAITCFDKAIEIDQNFALALDGKGFALANLKKYKESITCLEKVIEIKPQLSAKVNPTLAEAYYREGISLFHSNNFGEAIEAIGYFDKAIELNPSHKKAWHSKGESLLRLDEYLKAITCFDKAIEIDQNFALAWHGKGVALIKSVEYEKTKYREDITKFHKAIKYFDKAIEIDQNFAAPWYNKGRTLYELCKYEDAIICFDKVIEISQLQLTIEKNQQLTIPVKEDLAGVWGNKGLAFAKLGKVQEAITCFDKSIDINPKDEKSWTNKGVALAELGKYQEAVACYNKGIEINPKSTLVWNNKGYALYKLGMYEEAITCYDEAIRIDSQYAEAWYNKGVVQLKIGNAEEASKVFDKAHGIKLQEYKYWTGWITSLYEEGKLDKSLDICEKGIKYFKGKDEALKIDALKELFYQKGLILTKQEKSDEGLSAFKEASKFGNKQAQKEINRLIETKAGWWEWWFSDIWKTLLGIVFMVILIAMLFIPIVLLFPYKYKILKVSLEDFSKIWQIWIVCLLVLIFVLFHRHIQRIKTPWGEIEMPEPKATQDIYMPELKE
ncbi:tetratricopeptide repeat protein [Candidatus Kuenenia sp.]|uniref:tetratricopeptide repeat protein n=1 Tax=Candidatus Kuenenia sp. TaxID=2499824 RepID=UPI00321FFB14